jgi:hypothetical protein
VTEVGTLIVDLQLVDHETNDGDLDMAQAAHRIVDLASRDIDVADATGRKFDTVAASPPSLVAPFAVILLNHAIRSP